MARNVHRKRETEVIFYVALYRLQLDEFLLNFLLNENAIERIPGTLIKFVVQTS